jgi:signal transduction histidine kinase
MGLAITRGLVAADGGRVWAENLAPRGASFSIAVPARTRAIASVE